jgi:DNA-directed RNA polymerase specialized sigma24 family protein
MTSITERPPAEERFREVFAHLGAVTAYARRRGSRDADGIAAETMSIAWRRLADLPRDEPLPWLYATARNLLLAERRATSRSVASEMPEPSVPAPELHGLDPELDRALRALGPVDREALLLVAWEDLTPTQAAHVLKLNPTAFRVRLLRARRRLRAALEEDRRPASLVHIDVEGT